MTSNQIKDIIEKNKNDIAFVAGNGVNRYPDNPNALSWDNLLIKLWNKVSSDKISSIPKGISLTEFYDILELENKEKINLQKEVAGFMEDWKPVCHHFKIINKRRGKYEKI